MEREMIAIPLEEYKELIRTQGRAQALEQEVFNLNETLLGYRKGLISYILQVHTILKYIMKRGK